MRAYRRGCLYDFLAVLAVVGVIVAVLVSVASQVFGQERQPAPAVLDAPAASRSADAAQPVKLERLELLELRDLVHQREILRLQSEGIARQMKELEQAFDAKVVELAGKHRLDPKRTQLNLATGEMIINEK